MSGDPPQKGTANITHHSELVEESRRTAAMRYGINDSAANALISPLRSLTLASVEMMGERAEHVGRNDWVGVMAYV